MKTFTLSEIASHNSRDDCYVIVHGKVYDITKYLPQHPGGSNLIFKNAGKDSTGDFEGMFHSQKARMILERYCVGVLEGAKNQSAGGISQAGRLMAWRNISQGSLAKSSSTSSGAAGKFLRSRVGGSALSSSKGGLPPPSGSRRTKKPTMHQRTYTKYQLIDKKPCPHARNCYLLKFKLNRPTARLLCPLGQHIQIRIPIEEESTVESTTTVAESSPNQDTGNQVITLSVPTGENDGSIPESRFLERKYTPINISQSGSFELLVKCYPDNLHSKNSVSNYLCHKMDYHDNIEMRGPFGTYQYQPNRTKYLGIMVCGSGITPVYRIIESILQNRRMDSTRIILFYSNRTKKDIIMKQQLEEWLAQEGSSERFQVHHILSAEDGEESNKTSDGDNDTINNADSGNTNKPIYHFSQRLSLPLARKHFLPQEMQKEDYIPNRRHFYALVCGTDAYVGHALEICQELDINTQSQVHVF